MNLQIVIPKMLNIEQSTSPYPIAATNLHTICIRKLKSDEKEKKSKNNKLIRK